MNIATDRTQPHRFYGYNLAGAAVEGAGQHIGIPLQRLAARARSAANSPFRKNRACCGTVVSCLTATWMSGAVVDSRPPWPYGGRIRGGRMQILMTGGTGLIGGALIRELREERCAHDSLEPAPGFEPRTY